MVFGSGIRRPWLSALAPLARLGFSSDVFTEQGGMPIDPKQWPILSRLLDEALEVPAEARERFQRELGSGGMGGVWPARRSDGLIKRPIALKLPHSGPHGPRRVHRSEIHRTPRGFGGRRHGGDGRGRRDSHSRAAQSLRRVGIHAKSRGQSN